MTIWLMPYNGAVATLAFTWIICLVLIILAIIAEEKSENRGGFILLFIWHLIVGFAIVSLDKGM